MSDLISRNEMLRTYQEVCMNIACSECSFYFSDALTGDCLLEKWIHSLPSVEPERLTDDFETIRIHLNAYKEKLCNQQRWKEAEEYQRIIDRFMAFASAESERHLTCKNCIHLGHAYMMPCKNCKRNQMLPDWYEERRKE